MIAPGHKALHSIEDDADEADSPSLVSDAESAQRGGAIDAANEDSSAHGDAQQEPRPRMKRSQILIGAVLGGVITFLVGVVILVALNRNTLPVLTEDRLETARALWENSEITSYSMTVEISGAQPGQVEIEVEDSQPIKLVRDGEVPPRRTWAAWTIAGQYDMIDLDIANRAEPQQAFGVSDPASVTLYARFDDRNGIPLHYRRFVAGRPYTVEWVIKDFKPNRP